MIVQFTKVANVLAASELSLSTTIIQSHSIKSCHQRQLDAMPTQYIISAQHYDVVNKSKMRQYTTAIFIQCISQCRLKGEQSGLCNTDSEHSKHSRRPLPLLGLPAFLSGAQNVNNGNSYIVCCMPPECQSCHVICHLLCCLAIFELLSCKGYGLTALQNIPALPKSNNICLGHSTTVPCYSDSGMVTWHVTLLSCFEHVVWECKRRERKVWLCWGCTQFWLTDWLTGWLTDNCACQLEENIWSCTQHEWHNTGDYRELYEEILGSYCICLQCLAV